MQNQLRLSFHKDPLTLDPRKCCDLISSAAIFLLFRGLTRLEANYQIHYDLADSLHTSEDGKTYVFRLGNHKWSDGSSITAHDFEHSWKRALSPDFPLKSADFFYPIKNAEKIQKGLLPPKDLAVHAKDEKTLVVELESPCPHFLELTSFCPLFPIPIHSEAKLGYVCSGSFQLERWEKGKELKLSKNPFYTKPSQISLDHIHIRIIKDEKKSYDLFENGDLDWIGDPISPLPVNYLPELMQSRKIKPIGGLVSCVFNTMEHPFSNLELRKAFSLSIHKHKILNKLLLSNAFAANGPIPPILKQKNPEAVPDADSSLARAAFDLALKEMKIKKSKMKIHLTFEPTELKFRIAKMLQANWQEAFDINVQLEPLEFKILCDRLHKHQFSIALTRWTAQYNDPINILEIFYDRECPKNLSGWEDPKYQTLINRYMKTTDSEKRLQLAEQAETLLMNEMPIAPIYYYSYSYLQQPHLKNLAISPIGVVQFDRVKIDKRPMMEQQPKELSLLQAISR
jgi:oligopeptide transport system substrate-binding protein